MALQGLDQIPRRTDALFLRLLTLARAQYGAALARARLQECDRDQELPGERRIELTLTQAADVHSFLVSTALYWSTLREMVQGIAEPNLRPNLEIYEDAATNAKTARDHMEHLNERITQGRTARWGEPMSVEDFRTAVGAFDGSHISFGSERFQIDEMLHAIDDSAEAIAPLLRDATTPRFEVRVDPPQK